MVSVKHLYWFPCMMCRLWSGLQQRLHANFEIVILVPDSAIMRFRVFPPFPEWVGGWMSKREERKRVSKWVLKRWQLHLPMTLPTSSLWAGTTATQSDGVCCKVTITIEWHSCGAATVSVGGTGLQSVHGFLTTNSAVFTVLVPMQTTWEGERERERTYPFSSSPLVISSSFCMIFDLVASFRETLLMVSTLSAIPHSCLSEAITTHCIQEKSLALQVTWN